MLTAALPLVHLMTLAQKKVERTKTARQKPLPKGMTLQPAQEVQENKRCWTETGTDLEESQMPTPYWEMRRTKRKNIEMMLRATPMDDPENRQLCIQCCGRSGKKTREKKRQRSVGQRYRDRGVTPKLFVTTLRAVNDANEIVRYTTMSGIFTVRGARVVQEKAGTPAQKQSQRKTKNLSWRTNQSLHGWSQRQ